MTFQHYTKNTSNIINQHLHFHPLLIFVLGLVKHPLKSYYSFNAELLFCYWRCDNATVNWHPNGNSPCIIWGQSFSIFLWRRNKCHHQVLLIKSRQEISTQQPIDNLCTVNDSKEFGRSFCDHHHLGSCVSNLRVIMLCFWMWIKEIHFPFQFWE